MNDIKRAVKDQFGANAEKYVSSEVHSRGDSLKLLMELARPQYDWKVLDIATGGGHNALAFSRLSGTVIAGDMTHGMVKAAREHSWKKSKNNVEFIQFDAEILPFSDCSFDCVTSRIAPHHFPTVRNFISEAARALKRGGVLALADNMSPDEARSAMYYNLLEKIRDLSHHWAFSVNEWRQMLGEAGLTVETIELISKDLDFQDWARRTNSSATAIIKLEAMLNRAPTNMVTRFNPRISDGRLIFSLEEAVIVARKSKS